MARDIRFRRPEFQEKLARARGYERTARFNIGWKRWTLLAAAAAIVYFLAVSQKLLIKEANTAGNGPGAGQIQAVLARMQSERLAYIIPKNHFLILNKKELLAEIQKELPQIRAITVFKKKWPAGLELALEERTPLYVWQTGQNYYLLDQDGVVFQKIPAYTPETFSQILIVDSQAALVKTGEELDIKTILGFVEEIRKKWTQYINQANYLYFSIPGIKSQDIIVKTAVGFNVYFDLERNASSQLENLKIVLGREIRPETYAGLSYIDLRLPQTAYYCYKDAPCAPEYIKP